MTIAVKCVLVLGILIILALIWGYSETRRYQITEYTVESDKRKALQKQTVVFISDMHDHVYKNKNQGLLQDIRNQNPSVILIGGDMLIGVRDYDSRQALDFVRSLVDIAPVYYALGNHEQRMKEDPDKYENYWEGFYRELKSAGIHFLDNESVRLHFPEEKDEVWIGGLTVPSEYYHKIHPEQLEPATIEACIGRMDPERYQILMAHNPSFMNAYKAVNPDLILCGHFHGGIMRIPGWRGVISPQFQLFPKYSGEMRAEGAQTIIVSRGLGTHTIPLRFFNIPELIVIHF